MKIAITNQKVKNKVLIVKLNIGTKITLGLSVINLAEAFKVSLMF